MIWINCKDRKSKFAGTLRRIDMQQLACLRAQSAHQAHLTILVLNSLGNMQNKMVKVEGSKESLLVQGDLLSVNVVHFRR